MQTFEADETIQRLDPDSTIDKVKLKGRDKESAAKSDKRMSSAKKILNESQEKTVENVSKSKILEASASKKGFLDFLQKLEKTGDFEDRSLFLFQPVIQQPDQKLCTPYLPPMDSSKPVKYTLVLDLDETLVHFEENDDRTGGQFHIRPFAVDFLKIMAKNYELVIFTAAIKEVADHLT
jgi:hypothetical protein